MVAYCPETDPLYTRLKERFGALTHLKQYSDNKDVSMDECQFKSLSLT